MEIAILYKPLGGEVNYNHPFFPLKISENKVLLSDEKNSDPFEWAASCVAKFKTDKVSILIPGTKFDRYGTRYGKGGGWYDRFLSQIPVFWVRIGVTERSNISDMPLIRQKWDQPVDWLVVRNINSWEVIKCENKV